MKRGYKLLWVKAIAGKSRIPNKNGQTPRTAKKELTLYNPETGHQFSTNDLDMFKHKRDNVLRLFKDAYIRLFKNEMVSIFALVVDPGKYPQIGRFLSDFKKKFKRKGLEVFGHVWVRDVGDIRFEQHFHVLMATTRCKGQLFNRLFREKRHSGFDVKLCKDLRKLNAYLKKKELYGTHRQRSFGKSRVFRKPKVQMGKLVRHV